jgi:hypothetical protein
MKMYVGDIGWGNMDWIDLVQYRDRWRALVDTIINLHLHLEHSWVAVQVMASQEGLSSIV